MADLRDEGDEPAEPVARIEVRVGDDMREIRHVQEVADHGHCGPERVAERGQRVDAAPVHRPVTDASQDREAGAGAADRPALGDMRIQRVRHRRALPVAHVVRLVAAREEHAVGPGDERQNARILGGLAVVEHHGLDRDRAADVAVDFLACLAVA